LSTSDRFSTLRSTYPNAILFGCSTGGEIFDMRVLDESLIVTAVEFAHADVKLARTSISKSTQSRAAGVELASGLACEGLRPVLVLADGLRVNGSALVNGLREGLPAAIGVTGGMAGDGERLSRTLVCANAPPAEGVIAALGFYGSNLKVGFGSL